jgi:hypothetical protein
MKKKNIWKKIKMAFSWKSLQVFEEELYNLNVLESWRVDVFAAGRDTLNWFVSKNSDIGKKLLQSLYLVS